MTKHQIPLLKATAAALCLCLSFGTVVSAHHGGNGSSHHNSTHCGNTGSACYYYCEGHEAHLHTNGVCPYLSCTDGTHHHGNASTVTASKNTASGSTSAKTTAAPATIKLNCSSLTLLKGKGKTLKLSGTSADITWSSSDETVATVSKNGKVTAVGKGSATITAQTSAGEKTCKVKVETPKLSEYKLSLHLSDSHTLKVSGTSQKVVWSCSDSDILWIDDDGTLIASETGTATITASIGTSKTGVVKLKCRVTVTE